MTSLKNLDAHMQALSFLTVDMIVDCKKNAA